MRTVRINLSDYLNLITKKAYEAWMRLPPQTRSWIDVDDLVQEGLMHARFKVVERYEPGEIPFSTYLWCALDNFYKGIVNYHYAAKRRDGKNVALPARLPDTACPFDEDFATYEAFIKLFNRVSPETRARLAVWVFRMDTTKLHTRNPRFARVRADLQEVGDWLRFEHEDMERILKNDTWKLRLRG